MRRSVCLKVCVHVIVVLAVALVAGCISLPGREPEHRQQAAKLAEQGHNAYIRGESALALGLYLRALDISESYDDLPRVAEYLGSAATLLYLTGDLDQAELYAEEALAIEQSQGNTVGIVRANEIAPNAN